MQMRVVQVAAGRRASAHVLVVPPVRNGETLSLVRAVVNGEVVEHRTTYVVELQTQLRRLIEIAVQAGYGSDDRVSQAQELIRCRVTGCGLGGACGGRGTTEYPCPLSSGR